MEPRNTRYSTEPEAAAYPPEYWAMSLADADRVLGLLEAKPPARVLDLACGNGGATTVLAQRGFQVTGVDVDAARIANARAGSADKRAGVEWRCMDMRAIDYEAEMDFVLLRDVIFTIFEDESDDADMVRRIARALMPGGKCLFEVYNKEFGLAHGVQDTFQYDACRGRFAMEGEPVTLKLYTHEEWRELLGAAGLAVVAMDGWNWPGDPDPPPWRADFIVAEKRR